MSPLSHTELRELAKNLLQEAAQHLRKGPGEPVDHQGIKDLLSKHSALQIHHTYHRDRLESWWNGMSRFRHWFVFAAPILAIILAVCHVSNTPIDFQWEATKIEFRLTSFGSGQALFPGDVELVGLGASPVDRLMVSNADGSQKTYPETRNDTDAQFSIEPGDYSIVLKSVDLPSGATVTIGHGEVPSECNVVIVMSQPATGDVARMTITGYIPPKTAYQVSGNFKTSTLPVSENVRPFEFSSLRRELRLRLRFKDSNVVFSPRLAIAGLDLTEELWPSGDQRLRTSAIVSGEIHRDYVAAEDIKLRQGKPLLLKVTQGELRALKWTSGTAGGLFLGYVSQLESNGKDLRPTRLDYLRIKCRLAEVGLVFFYFAVLFWKRQEPSSQPEFI